MRNFLAKYKAQAVGLFALAFMFAATAATHAAAIDYASTTAAVDDATSGLGSMLISGSLKVIGIALGVWGLFFLIGKLRKHTK